MELKNKLQFLKAVMSDILVIHKRDERDIVRDMESQKIDKQEGGYDYLLSLPIKSFSKQKIDALTGKKDDIKQKIHTIKNTTPNRLWMNDLNALLVKLN